jgi:photosystem II stability/assembly factor-like uncharacterized protein
MRRSALVLLLTQLPLVATAGTWQQAPLPFENAMVRVLAVAPSQAGRVYAGLDYYGVIRTDNRGLSWEGVGAGFPIDSRPSALEVAPGDADLVFAGTRAGEVLRSTDAGATWTDVTPAAAIGEVTEILMHTGIPSVVHAAVWQGAEPGVYRSTDGGTTWAASSLGVIQVRSLAAQPGNPDVILAGLQVGASRSTDAGLTWTAMASSAWYTELEYSLADPNLVFGVSHQGDIWRSGDAGVSFSQLGPLPAEWYGATAVACHPLNASVLVAAGSGYGCNPINGFFPHGWRSTDAGDSWAITDVTAACESGVASSLQFDPVSPAYLYRGTYALQGRGFVVSTDLGTSWQTRVAGLQNYGVAEIAGDETGTTYALRLETFYRSVGNPLAWTERAASDAQPYHVSEGLEVNITNPNILHEVGYFGSELLEQFALRSDDGAMIWNGLFFVPGLPPGQATLWSNHGDGQHVYAVSYQDLYRSDDGHASYSFVRPGMEYGAHLVVDPGDWRRLFATGVDGAVISLSTDGGVTFTPRDAGLPPVNPWDVLALFMRRTDPGYLVLVLGNGEVWETEDAGLAWSQRFAFDLSAFPTWYEMDVTWDPASGHVFLAGLGLGQGPGQGIVTAHPGFNPAGLPTARINSVHFSPGLGRLFAATAAHGVWIQDIAPPTGVGPSVAGGAAGLGVAPNPFRSRTTLSLSGRETGGSVPLTIVDVTGRTVKRLEATAGRVTWDGTDAAGRRLPSGVYFVRAPGLGARRILILR